MTKLDTTTFYELVRLLIPLVSTQQDRHALLHLAFDDAPIVAQIDYTGSPEAFATNTIRTLIVHGEIEPGKQALWVLLETVREKVGVDKQRSIDMLHDVINVPGERLALDDWNIDDKSTHPPNITASIQDSPDTQQAIGNDNVQIRDGGIAAGRDIHMHGGEMVGRDKIVNNYYSTGANTALYPYKEDDLLTHYNERFVGRADALAEVAAWINGSAGGYLFFEDGPGAGKSALMARLVHLHQQGEFAPDAHLSYVFIRREKGNQYAKHVYAALNQQWLDVLNPGGGVPASADQLRRQTQNLLETIRARATAEKPWVILVDGLDEAEDSDGEPVEAWLLERLLPSRVWPHVYWVLTSRPNPDARNLTTWMHALKDVEPRRLARFGVDEVRALLTQAGDTPPRDEALLQKMVEVTGGEPLYLRFLVEDVRHWGEEAAARLVDPKLPRKVEGYFRQQLNELRAHHKTVTWDVLGVLTVARGPLSLDDLADILDLDYFEVEEAIQSIARYLMGKTRYVLMHLEFRNLLEHAFKRSRSKYVQQVVDYCARWQALDDPTYALDYYAAHLYHDCRDFEALHALITKAWMQARYEQEGVYSGFLADVDLAWRVAEEAEPPQYGLIIRYTLMHSSVVAIEGNVSPELLALLVENGVWTPERALVYAQRAPSADQCAKALVALTAHLPAELMPQALEAARAVADEGSRASLLSSLVPHLPEAQRLEALAQALEAALAIANEERRAEALSGLAEHMPADLMPQALDAVRTIADERSRADVLRDLAPHLPADLVPQALDAVRAIASEKSRADALSDLAPHLPADLMPQALDAVRAIASEKSRADALSGLAPHLPADLMVQALDAAHAIPNVFSRADALSRLAPYLPAELMPQALEAARAAIPDNIFGFSAFVLSDLAPHLPTELMPQALEAACAIADEWHRAGALKRLAPHLPADLMPQALDVVRTIAAEWICADALKGLAPHLPADLMPEALEAARAIADEWICADALKGLAPHLPADLMPEALEAARAIASERNRADVLRGLAAHLPAELMPQALEAARAIADEWRRADALSDLAPHLPTELMPQALEAARAIASERNRADVLRGLAAHLPADLVPQALEAARAIAFKKNRAYALSGLAPHLTSTQRPKVLVQVLEAARVIADEWSRANALSRLALHLPDTQQPEALAQVLETACAIASGLIRASILNGLAPHLPADLMPQALETAHAIADEGSRASALCGLMSHLPGTQQPEVLAQALEAARAIADEGNRAFILNGLTPHLPDIQRPEVLAQALEAARAIASERNRADALRGLAAHLPADLMPEALEAARAIADERSRADALRGLAAHLPDTQQGEVLAQALEAACAIAFEGSRADALRGLAAHLPADLMPEALEAARAIADERSRADALSSLAPHLPDTQQGEVLAQALEAACAIASEGSRADALSSLAPHLPDTQRGEALAQALEAARAIADERSRADALSSLAPHLPDTQQGEILAQALEAAHAIDDEGDRANVLRHLAKHLHAALYDLWNVYCRALTTTARSHMLSAVVTLATLTADDEQGLEIMQATLQAILDTAEWWP